MFAKLPGINARLHRRFIFVPADEAGTKATSVANRERAKETAGVSVRERAESVDTEPSPQDFCVLHEHATSRIYFKRMFFANQATDMH